MVATATITTRGLQDAALTAAADRLINTILVSEGVVGLAGNSFKVAQDTGSNMQVLVGSGTAGDRAAIQGDVAGQGVYIVEHDNATQALVVAASDPSNPRIDRVILRVYDDDEDSSGNSYADVEVLPGTPAGSPSAPAVPDSAISLATIEVGAGVSAVTDADITDTRSEAQIRQAALMDSLPVLRGRNYVGGVQNWSTTEGTIATVNLTIPTDWNTYDVDAFWSTRSNENGAGGPATVALRLKLAGSLLSQQLEELSNAADEDEEAIAGVAFSEGATTTGAVAVTLTAQLNAEDTKFRCANTNLIVYAWRTS